MTKTIIVTGGCGFIGHHFVEHLLKNTDWNIIIIDKHEPKSFSSFIKTASGFGGCNAAALFKKI